MNSRALTDKFGRQHTYLRISLTDACNLRCQYCMPNEKVSVTPSKRLMQSDEILEIAKIFVELGVNKIRLTGGEPLVRKDVDDILLNLAVLPVELTMSTNAILIQEHLSSLKNAKINSLNISLDSLDKEVFFRMTKRPYFDKIMSNIQLLLSENFKLKINVVPLKNVNEDAIFDFIAWTKDHELEVRFIEFMPFLGNAWDLSHVLSYEEMLKRVSAKYKIEKLDDAPNDTAKHYQVQGYKGKFAFISTITDPFCSTCNRLRLTADGKMKNCLFSNGEIDLLSSFREGKDIRPLILENVLSKKQERGGVFEENGFSNYTNRSMIKIGG